MYGLLLIPAAMITASIFMERDPVQEQVILLPAADGSVGSVIVTSTDGSRTLDQAYQAVDVTSSGRLASAQESAGSVKDRFGAVLDAAPPPEVTFVLYFEAGSGETLTPASLEKVDELRDVLLQRPAPEIAVVGHTDTVGKLTDNDELARLRAQTVKRKIEEAGISALSIQAVGRGERELLITTADEVSEARNRRVEITIR